MSEPKTLPYAAKAECRRYDGRVAIVTGAAQGLGRVIARRLAEEGAKVVVADIQEERVKRTARLLQEENGQPFLALGGDLGREGVAEDMVARTLAEFGRIDTLVNNAAALIRMRLVDFTEELLRFWSDRLPRSRKNTRWDEILQVLVCYRLITPGSEWRLHREGFGDSAMADLLGGDSGLAEAYKLYACHDRLLEHEQALFSHLVERWRDLRPATAHPSTG